MKKILTLLLALCLVMGLAVCVSAEPNTEYVYDEAGLLDAQVEDALRKKLMLLSDAYDAQIIVATVKTLDGEDIDVFLEDSYDSMGFGFGENHDGVFLLVCMDVREYRILSNGYAGQAIDTDTIDIIGDEITPYLSDGAYAEAFDTFADECAYYLDGHLNGFPFDAGGTFVICLVIGLVVGIIVALVLKGQLKTVRKQNQAQEYVKPGSMQLRLHSDLFLYRNVTRTKKESSSGSSKSGSSRSTGGGSF